MKPDFRKFSMQEFLSSSTPFYLAVAVAAAAPAFASKYLPIQDLPFHTAATRVIHDYSNPAFGFEEHFSLTLGRTQYVFYYLCTSLLSTFLGVIRANQAMLAFYLGGTFLAVRSLVRALGKDERLSLLVLPILVNVMFMFGLLPFLIGIPIMFWGLARLVVQLERPSLANGLLLAALGIALFYCHVFPFGIFCLGYAAMFPYLRIERYLSVGLPAVPAALATLRWIFFTDAGKLTSGVVADNARDPVVPVTQALPEAFRWINNVFSGKNDELSLIGFGVLIVATVGLSQGDRESSRGSASKAYTLLPLVCIPLYFVLPQAHDYIWLIAQRFPILFLLTLVPMLRFPKGIRGHVVAALALGLGGRSMFDTVQTFRQFASKEVGDFDGALAAIPSKQKVAALIFDKGSAILNGDLFVPFLHFGSYYQAEKGGVVQFTYAGYKHWPFDFKPGKYPPPGGPARQRWEWTPEQVGAEELAYYTYVLVRGNDSFRPSGGAFRKVWSGSKWEVWQNTQVSP